MNNLKVGFSAVNANPPLGIDVAGYYVPRYAKGFLDDIMVKTLVLECGEKKIALISVDNCGIKAAVSKPWMEEIEAVTGIPFDNIFLSATHTHTGPQIHMGSTEDKLIAAYRYAYFAMAGGAYLEWTEGDGATKQMFESCKTYNYMTGEEVTELSDVFHEGSGYENVIRNKTRETLAWKTEYSWSEISALLDTLQYRLDGISVYVTIPSLDDFYLRVYFGEFEDAMLKLFD